MKYLNKSFSVFGGFGETRLNVMSDEDRIKAREFGKSIQKEVDQDSGILVLENEENIIDEFSSGSCKEKTKITDEKGNEINLSSHQKNSLYSQAKKLESEIKESLCTKDECWTPNHKNVQKMINSEFQANGKIEKFQKAMKALGADPKEFNIEKLRRGK
jgi:hypothetical protein